MPARTTRPRRRRRRRTRRRTRSGCSQLSARVWWASVGVLAGGPSGARLGARSEVRNGGGGPKLGPEKSARGSDLGQSWHTLGAVVALCCESLAPALHMQCSCTTLLLHSQRAAVSAVPVQCQYSASVPPVPHQSSSSAASRPGSTRRIAPSVGRQACRRTASPERTCGRRRSHAWQPMMRHTRGAQRDAAGCASMGAASPDPPVAAPVAGRRVARPRTGHVARALCRCADGAAYRRSESSRRCAGALPTVTLRSDAPLDPSGEPDQPAAADGAAGSRAAVAVAATSWPRKEVEPRPEEPRSHRCGEARRLRPLRPAGSRDMV